MGELAFRPEDHSYWLDGARLPGVTEVLKYYGIVSFDGAPEATLERARHRGLAVHFLIRLIQEGTLDPTTVAPELDGYAFAYQAFCADTGFLPVVFEQPLV